MRLTTLPAPFLACLLAATLNAQDPTNYIVNSLGDAPAANPADGTGLTTGGDVTLRSAMMTANVDGVPSSIEFSDTLFSAGPAEILAGSTLPAITTPLSIFGPGADTLTVRTNGFRVFVFKNGAQGILWGMRITGSTQGAVLNSNSELRIIECVLRDNNGAATNLAGGGGVDNSNGGQLLLRDSIIGPGNTAVFSGAVDNFFGGGNSLVAINSTFIGNSATNSGGVIYSGGTGNSATLLNCTITRNAAGSNGGALYEDGETATGGMSLVNCTVVGNSAGGFCGGIYVFGTTGVLLQNTIVAGNTEAGNVQVNIDGVVSSSSSFNFVGENQWMTGITNGVNGNQIGTAASPISPNLGALGDNGGPVPTMVPNEGSPVIDKGSPTIPALLSDFNISTDARGKARLVGSAVDVGAVEVQEDIPVIPGDYNGDGVVNVEDVTALARHIKFGDPVVGDSDYNGDESVNMDDVADLANDIANGTVPAP